MDYNSVPTSAGFIIEYRERPGPSVRLLYHEPDPRNPDVRFVFLANKINPCPDDWCPLEDFIRMLQPNSIPDWRLACRIQDNCPKISHSTQCRYVPHQAKGLFSNYAIVFRIPTAKCAIENDKSSEYTIQSSHRFIPLVRGRIPQKPVCCSAVWGRIV